MSPKNKIQYLLCISLIFSSLSLASNSQKINNAGVMQSTQVTQHGVTWTFDHAYSIGQFANGDWWVLGPVVIMTISPDFDGSLHGWQVNPMPNTGSQGFDNRVPYWTFDSNLVPNLPYLASAGDSLVKAISGDGRCTPDDDPSTHPCYLDTAAVLTVLDKIPVDNGASFFRPSYMGNTDKTLYSINAINLDLLPDLGSVADAPSLLEIQADFNRVQLDYSSSFIGRYLHPAQNMSQYGAEIALNTNMAALRLMLDDPIEEKMPALIVYLQAGIDWFHMMDSGANWIPNGGHQVGRKLPLVFTAVLLDNQNMKQALLNTPDNYFSEDGQTYYGQNGRALFGQADTESNYWRRIRDGVGKRDIRDPYGFVDGGGNEIGQAYQYCCTAQPFKGSALAALLLPGGKATWNYNAFFDYTDRWVEFGVWSNPDPCALVEPNLFDGNCVSGGGRWTEIHGSYADEGFYGDIFIDNMWALYRETANDLIFSDSFE